MDPNANLEEMLELAESLLNADRYENFPRQDAERLSELVQALDGWLSAGGFLPSRWNEGQHAVA
jgi:hypothetical protein